MANLTEKQIREYTVVKIAIKWPSAIALKRNPFTQPRSTWIGNFTHKYSGSDVVHAFFVRRYRFEGAIQSLQPIWYYQIMTFYGFDFGKDSDNSEDKFQKQLDDVSEDVGSLDYYKFEEPDYTTEDTIAPESLLWEPIGIIGLESGKLHHAVARLRIRIFRC